MSSVVKASDLESRFLTAVSNGIKAWKDAGEILVKLEEQDPAAIIRLKTKHNVSGGVIKTFLAIGRGQLLPELVTAPEAIKRLPVADQQRVVQGNVEALVIKPDGSTDKVIVDVLKADRNMVAQVIGKDGIRSLSEQKAAIVAKVNAELATKAAGLAKKNDSPWWVDGKNVVITSGKYSRRDLQTMLNAIL